MKKKRYLKWGALLLIIGIGAGSAAVMPTAVESFMPRVETVRLLAQSCIPSVQASGTIQKHNEEWLAVVAVNEYDINQVQTGQEVELRGAAFPSGKYIGRVREISDTARQVPVMTSTETVIDVTVSISNGDDLRSGYTTEARIKTGEERTAYLLPYSAICQDEKGEYVYVLEHGKACRRDIVTGEELPDGAEIISGVAKDDSVIAEPENVHNGAYVLEADA